MWTTSFYVAYRKTDVIKQPSSLLLIWQWQQNLIAPPGFAVHAEMGNLPTHICQSQPVMMSQVIKELSHPQVRICCQNTDCAQHLVALCSWTQRLTTKEYQRTAPQVPAKANEETMKSTGLILLCWQQHLNDPTGQRFHCRVLTDSAFQSKESLLLWAATQPLLQSLLHSSTPTQENAG